MKLGVGTVLRRLPIGVLDAAFLSAGSLGCNILAARSLTTEAFGIFSTGLILLLLLTGLSRALHGDALSLRIGGREPDVLDNIRASTRAVIFGSLLASTLLAIFTLSLSSALGSVFTTTLLVLSVILPLSLIQDHLRWCAYARSRPKHALAATSTWTMCGLFAVGLISAHTAQAPLLLLAWGASAVSGICISLRLSKGSHPLRPPLQHWWRSRRRLLSKLGVDYALTQATGLAAPILIGAVVDLNTVGLIRKGSLWSGPLMVIVAGLIGGSQWNLIRQINAEGIRNSLGRITSVLAVPTAIMAVYSVLIIMLPAHLAELVVGDDWAAARNYVFPAVLIALAALWGGILGVAVRAIDRVSTQLAVRAILTPLGLLSILYAASQGGGLVAFWVTACVGVVFASALALILLHASHRGRQGNAVHIRSPR